MNNKKEFSAVFQLSKTEVFEVKYYTLGSNKTPHFSTSCAVFNRPKNDYNRCGQCQKDILYPRGKEGQNILKHLKKYNKYAHAREFFEFWDNHHIHELSDDLHARLMRDIEVLKEVYNHLYCDDITRVRRPGGGSFNFEDIKELSMQNPK